MAVGGELAWVSDIDRGAATLLAHRYPDVPNLGDLTAVDWAQVEPVDVITAGFPCQPFSDAGKRKGADDERAIWPWIAAAVRVVRPRAVVLENVVPVLRSEFGRVASDLATLGYDLSWTCVRASDVGAPHRRERLFVLAHAPCDGRPERRTRAAQRARPGGQPPSDRRAPADAESVGSTRALGLGDRRGRSETSPRDHGGAAADAGSRAGGAPRAGQGEAGAAGQPERGAASWGAYGPAVRRWESVLGRPAPNPLDDGRLSPRFVEFLMGLPDGWVTQVPGLSRTAQLKLLGNGVVPQQAAYALRLLGGAP